MPAPNELNDLARQTYALVASGQVSVAQAVASSAAIITTLTVMFPDSKQATGKVILQMLRDNAELLLGETLQARGNDDGR